MTNRMDNMTKDERREVSYPCKNYVLSQCCSVDDLRCYLSNYQYYTGDKGIGFLEDINEAIDFENSKPTPRVTIIKMLTAKANSIQKSIK
ncbi:MAG: hypothetical protein Q7U54_07975 [Bacteroidales bacterium]|nr:hypothetical protein [Bacteroidales bacterium]